MDSNREEDVVSLSRFPFSKSNVEELAEGLRMTYGFLLIWGVFIIFDGIFFYSGPIGTLLHLPFGLISICVGGWLVKRETQLYTKDNNYDGITKPMYLAVGLIGVLTLVQIIKTTIAVSQACYYLSKGAYDRMKQEYLTSLSHGEILWIVWTRAHVCLCGLLITIWILLMSITSLQKMTIGEDFINPSPSIYGLSHLLESEGQLKRDASTDHEDSVELQI